MEFQGRRVWQIAAGDTDRSYSRWCLDWGVVIDGPGEQGPWPVCAATPRKKADVRRLCEDLRDGDIVVLRLGTSDVHGVGVVRGAYQWFDDFGDIDGWDLQHVRRVQWLWKPVPQPRRFPAHTLHFGPTVQPLKSQVVLDWMNTLGLDLAATPAELPALPPSCKHGERVKDLDLPSIGRHLFDHGVARDHIGQLVQRIEELTETARWYQRSHHPSESETLAYLAVPLLRTLGWTPQRLAIEWNHVDAALFRDLPRDDARLVAVVEAKQLDSACLSARSQAEDYAKRPGREGCQRLIVTDGIRYGIFVRSKDGTFIDKPKAYMNLLRLRASYPVLGCQGAQAALLLMTPDWHGD